MDQEKIGQVIKEIRKKNNLTQLEFAEQFGVTYQAVSKWENGKNIPDIAILKQICAKYQIDINELLLGQDKKISNNKKIILISILTICLVGLILMVTYYINKDDNFEFKTLSSNCSNFSISGSIAYNKNKSSIYISHITYCGKKDLNIYKNISCTLYEVADKNKKKIDSYIEKNNQGKTLDDILKNITFKVDDYQKTCKAYTQNSLELEIDATNKKGEITTYKIPLKLDENCSNS